MQKLIPGKGSGIGKIMEKERHDTYVGSYVCPKLKMHGKDKFEKIR